MIRLLLFSLVLASTAVAQSSVEGPLGRVLDATVDRTGRVDYGRLAGSSRADLDAALAAIASQSPSALRSDAQKTAFLVNAYNAHVLDRVLDHPRATHIERADLFDELFETPVRVAGLSMTLNQLEHGILRGQSRVDGAAVSRSLRALRPSRLDARIHAALNCAAISCPPLQRRAFRSSTLDRDLDRTFSAWTGSDRAARVDGRRVVVSSLFDWFASDFEAGQDLGDAILAAMPSSRRSAFRPRLAGKSAAQLRSDRSVSFAYDWTINRR
ncbi:DUF547 domain-containing protein [Rubrivirga sp.]|uniref:DUF547 domain-containing protein n=1 Tax=Rubrivirga sp. TaxID=1885344 RepID=UPI003C76D818